MAQSSIKGDLLQEAVRFVEVDDETRSILREYLPSLKQALPGILNEFYNHIVKWDHLAQKFNSHDRIDHAKKAQTQHWVRLFEANFDNDYAQSVEKIGLIHSRVELEPIWYIGGYGFVLNRLYAHVSQQYKSRFSPEKAQEKTAKLLRAINQCVMIDMSLAISTYLDENERVYNEKLATLSNSFEEKIGGVVSGVSAAACQLEGNAEMLASMAMQTTSSSKQVVSLSDDAKNNTAVISSSAEEMSRAISELSEKAQKSYSEAEKAASKTGASVGVMVELKESIDQVSEVAGLISEIAEQTNLLALNATIEAARAGEAGKGFAVVASEVKNLANQTGQATEDIKSQVLEIIAKSDSAAQSLESVKKVIDSSKEISHSTAESVDDQKTAIREIAYNVDQASAGAYEISQNVGDINDASEEVQNAANQILDAAKSLAKQGVDLEGAVSKFIQDLRSEG